MTFVERLAARSDPRTQAKPQLREEGQGHVAVRDASADTEAETATRFCNAANPVGVGPIGIGRLSIHRSIVEADGRRAWVAHNDEPGTIASYRGRNVTASIDGIYRDRTPSSTHGRHLSILPARPSVTHNRSRQNTSHGSSCAGTPHLQQTPTIAIVDDDGSVRLAVESLVRSLGFGARTFASAQEFLQASALNEAACVIADVQMPGMSGVDLQDALLRLGHRIPFIFITAFPEDKIRDRVLKAGAASYLVKPFEGRTLIDCLQVALQKHQDGTGV